MWAGYMKVFHHGQYTLDAKCFQKESESEINTILSFMVYGGLSELLSTADSVYNLYYDNFMHCGVEETFVSIHDKCASSPSSCSIPTLIKNGEKNWMKLV